MEDSTSDTESTENNLEAPHPKLGWRELVIFLIFLFPLTFSLFHGFIFLVWYYWPVSHDVAIGLPSILFAIAAIRLGSFLPLPHKRNIQRADNVVLRTRPITDRGSIFELVLWYLITIYIYFHLYSRFQFPQSIEGLPTSLQFKILLFGYGAYFVVVIPIAVFSAPALNAFVKLTQEIINITHLFARIITVFCVYVSIDIFFALLYRLQEISGKGTFTQPLPSFIDAFYFSTVTLTTVGFGDIAPVTRFARLSVAVEALLGIALLGVFLTAAFSLPNKRRKRIEANIQRQTGTTGGDVGRL